MNRLLIIRLSAMGDVAMTEPIIRQLHEKYPDIRITLLTAPFFRPFFREIEGIEFVDIDVKKRHKGFWGVFRLYRDIRKKYKIDMVADLHDVLRTKLLRKLFLLRGTQVASIDKERDEKKALTDLENKVFRQLKTTHQRYADVFVRLGFDVGVPEKSERKSLPIPSAVREAAGDRATDGKSKWIGIAPFAQHRGKIYPHDKMEAVIRMLAEEYSGDIRLFLFGGGREEREAAEAWERRYPEIYSVIGKIGLGEELDLIANLDCMVSMDSSAMHMASLVGTPVVSIWGATHPYTGFLGLGQSPDNAVQIDLPCRPCSIYGNTPCVKGDYPCMNGIPPRAVVEKVKNVLGK